MISDLLSDSETYGKLVAENDIWRLWKNDMTQLYEKSLGEYNESGITLTGMFVVVFAENKQTGERMYLALDRRTQKPFADWTCPSDFELKKGLIQRDLKESCNIITMAESKLEEEK